MNACGQTDSRSLKIMKFCTLCWGQHIGSVGCADMSGDPGWNEGAGRRATIRANGADAPRSAQGLRRPCTSDHDMGLRLALAS
jgi:hypothetical protein